MVDLIATNAKLRARSERLVAIWPATSMRAPLLDAAAGSVKIAVVMAHRGVDRVEAERLLKAAQGRLAAIIDDPV